MKILRWLGMLSVSIASMFGTTPAVSAPSSMEEDKIVRKHDDNDIIGAHDWKTQGGYLPLKSMDDHVHRYIKIESLVSFENEKKGMLWDKVTMRIENDHTYVIVGKRSDGREYSASSKIDVYNRNDFDALCDRFNSFLAAEIA